MPVVIAMLNQKGGCGKTTLTANLGAGWAKAGRRVLLVDNDPQASLTQGMIGTAATLALDPVRTIAGIYAGTARDATHAIYASAFPDLHFMAGSKAAHAFNKSEPHLEPYGRQTCLREVVGDVADAYDLVLIDCPPNLYLCSWAALAAATDVLVPVQPEDYGAQGLADVLQSVNSVRSLINPPLRFLGIAASMIQPRRVLHQVYVDNLKASFPGLVFSSMIGHTADLSDATSNRKPVIWHKPKGAAARSISALIAEIDERILRGGEEVAA